MEPDVTRALPASELPAFLTPSELAELLRTSTGNLAVERYHRRGIPFIRRGRKILYSREAVRAYLDANTEETATA